MFSRHSYLCFLYSVCVALALYTTPSCRHSPLSGHDVLSRQLKVLLTSSLSFSLDKFFFLVAFYFLPHISHAAIAQFY